MAGGGVTMMTAVQRETVKHIRDSIGGQLFLSQDSDDALIIGEGWLICVDRDGDTSEVNGMEWETGWSC